MSDKIIQFPLPGKPHEKIDHVFIEIHPSFIDDGYMELKFGVHTNIEQYHTTKTLPRNVMVSYFDMVFEEAREELKRFMVDDAST